jgi:small subunit ribosomal protein S21
MTQIIPGESEGVESVLRRFKREVSKAGIFQDMKKNRHFETPIEMGGGNLTLCIIWMMG